jgi:hypothetical protein
MFRLSSVGQRSLEINNIGYFANSPRKMMLRFTPRHYENSLKSERKDNRERKLGSPRIRSVGVEGSQLYTCDNESSQNFLPARLYTLGSSSHQD